jgi:hypothetical protein
MDDQDERAEERAKVKVDFHERTFSFWDRGIKPSVVFSSLMYTLAGMRLVKLSKTIEEMKSTNER